VIVEARAGDDADAIAWQTWLRTEHVPEVLATPGVAGVWRYGDSSTWRLVARARGDVRQDTTVVYLDDDPLVTTQRLLPLVERRWASGAVRPVFAGPMRTMVEWEAWT
jgi:hypothetical protein